MSPGSRAPVLMTVVSAALWGSSFTVVKVGLRYLDPYSFVLLRFGLATAILVAIVLARGQWRLFRSYVWDRYVLLLGVTIAASYAFQFVGQTMTTASRAVIIVNSSAILIAPMSYLLLKEAMGPRKLAALAVGVFGVYLITRGRAAGAAEGSTLSGDLLVAGASVAYGLYVVFTKMTISRRAYSEVVLMAAVFLWSLPIFLAIGVPALARGVNVSTSALAAIGYLAVFCSILPFVIWTAALKQMGALTSAIVLLAELVLGVLFARLLLAETISTSVAAGCGAICAAILLVGTKE